MALQITFTGINNSRGNAVTYWVIARDTYDKMANQTMIELAGYESQSVATAMATNAPGEAEARDIVTVTGDPGSVANCYAAVLATEKYSSATSV